MHPGLCERDHNYWLPPVGWFAHNILSSLPPVDIGAMQCIPPTVATRETHPHHQLLLTQTWSAPICKRIQSRFRLKISGFRIDIRSRFLAVPVYSVLLDSVCLNVKTPTSPGLHTQEWRYIQDTSKINVWRNKSHLLLQRTWRRRQALILEGEEENVSENNIFWI